MTLAELGARVAAHDPLTLPVGQSQPAAVLVPVRERSDGAVEIVLIRRTEDQTLHSGQVAFPGGRLEPDDADATAAALREAEEELGIAPAAVRVLGRLDDLVTVTGYHVTPVVGALAVDTPLVPNPEEVARVFTVTLDELLDERRWQAQEHRWQGSALKVWHFPHDGEDVWGATAHMLRELVGVLRRWRAQ